MAFVCGNYTRQQRKEKHIVCRMMSGKEKMEKK